MRHRSLALGIVIVWLATLSAACQKDRKIIDFQDYDAVAGAPGSPAKAGPPSNGSSPTSWGSKSNTIDDSGCLKEADLDYVVEPAKYDLFRGKLRIRADGDTLYFATADEVFSVPAAGGAPERLYLDSDPEIKSGAYDKSIQEIWLRDKDILIVYEGAITSARLISVPKAGGPATELPPLHYNCGRFEFNGTQVICQEEYKDYFARAPEGKDEIQLPRTVMDQTASYSVDGDYLIAKETELYVDDAMYRLPIMRGATASKLEIPGDEIYFLLGAAGGFVYYTSYASESIKRVPVLGGAATELGPDMATALYTAASADGGLLVVGHSSYAGQNTQLHVDYLSKGATAFGEHLCVASTLFDTKLVTETSVALAGSTLYFPVTTGEQVGIARYELESGQD